MDDHSQGGESTRDTDSQSVPGVEIKVRKEFQWKKVATLKRFGLNEPAYSKRSLQLGVIYTFHTAMDLPPKARGKACFEKKKKIICNLFNGVSLVDFLNELVNPQEKSKKKHICTPHASKHGQGN